MRSHTELARIGDRSRSLKDVTIFYRVKPQPQSQGRILMGVNFSQLRYVCSLTYRRTLTRDLFSVTNLVCSILAIGRILIAR